MGCYRTMNNGKAEKEHGLSLRLMIILMFIIGIVTSGILLRESYQLTVQYDETEDATQDYLVCQDIVYTVRDTIHELNEHARNYVVSGNPEEVKGYSVEVLEKHSIEGARDSLRDCQPDEKTLAHLETAIGLNDQMADVQLRAMRLAAQAWGYDVDRYSELLRQVELSEEDRALSADEQLDRALEILFSKDYTQMKSQVDIHISLCKETLVEFMNGRHLDSLDQLRVLLHRHRRLVIGMVAGMLLVLIFILALVVYPIHNLVKGIRSTKEVKPQGSSEIHFLAEIYNQMYENMERTNNQLSYEASHDALTGLYNRTAYEALRGEVVGHNIALILLDVDRFKEVNDTYGHDIGDKVLVRVAGVLRDSFREADRICRIGGDEFCVIMMGATSSLTEVIRKKIANASQILDVVEEGVPAVTVSVGCAFSDQLREDESLFKNADRALYRVKNNGRNNCGFYHAVAENN